MECDNHVERIARKINFDNVPFGEHTNRMKS